MTFFITILLFALTIGQLQATLQRDLLTYINDFRHLHSGGPLINSPSVTSLAQNAAFKLSKNGDTTAVYNPNFSTNYCTFRGKLGDLAQACAVAWYTTLKHHNWCTPKATGKSSPFINMIWNTTSRAGTGISKGKDGTYYVVTYFLPKKDSHVKQNVKPVKIVTQASDKAVCASGYTRFGSSCFKFHRQKATWDEAVVLCTKENATLTSVRNQKEEKFLRTLQEKGSGKGWMWIGLQDRSHEGDFSWLDGLDFAPNVCAPVSANGGKAQNCVAWTTNNPPSCWSDRTCSERLPFMCRMPIEGKSTFRAEILYSKFRWNPNFKNPSSKAYRDLRRGMQITFKEVFQRSSGRIGGGLRDIKILSVRPLSIQGKKRGTAITLSLQFRSAVADPTLKFQKFLRPSERIISITVDRPALHKSSSLTKTMCSFPCRRKAKSHCPGWSYYTTGHYHHTGYQTPGYHNAGYQTPGYHNAGYHNAGYHNTEYNNAGYHNAGYHNTGYHNAGYQYTGYECPPTCTQYTYSTCPDNCPQTCCSQTYGSSVISTLKPTQPPTPTNPPTPSITNPPQPTATIATAAAITPTVLPITNQPVQSSWSGYPSYQPYSPCNTCHLSYSSPYCFTYCDKACCKQPPKVDDLKEIVADMRENLNKFKAIVNFGKNADLPGFDGNRVPVFGQKAKLAVKNLKRNIAKFEARIKNGKKIFGKKNKTIHHDKNYLPFFKEQIQDIGDDTDINTQDLNTDEPSEEETKEDESIYLPTNLDQDNEHSSQEDAQAPNKNKSQNKGKYGEDDSYIGSSLKTNSTDKVHEEDNYFDTQSNTAGPINNTSTNTMPREEDYVETRFNTAGPLNNTSTNTMPREEDHFDTQSNTTDPLNNTSTETMPNEELFDQNEFDIDNHLGIPNEEHYVERESKIGGSLNNTTTYTTPQDDYNASSKEHPSESTLTKVGTPNEEHYIQDDFNGGG